MSYKEKAVNLFESGYNCSQSIVLAFKDILPLEEETLKSISSSFGGGVSRLREVCGCISGMGIVFGLLYGNYDVNNVEEKAKHYELIQKLALKFKETMKSYRCYELLNLEEKPSDPKKCQRDQNYYQTRPCGKFIAYMAELMEKEIQSHE